MSKVKVAIDIESLDTTETNGYDIVIPNYAVVPIPNKPTKDITSFIYVKLPFQEQINKGLHVGAGSMDFWFNYCRQNHPNALEEVISTLTLQKPEVCYTLCDDEEGVEYYTTDDVLEMWRSLRYDRYGQENDLEVWGNGCNFDCSVTQANHKKLFGTGDLWKYNAPQNARSVKLLLNEDERVEMDAIVKVQLAKFIEHAKSFDINNLELHHPLYDAAREAIQISYCLNKKG